MLSIGKVGMSAGQQMYYEEQVAAGREDYYAGNGEAPGRWTGSGARALGLSRELDAEQLKSLMDGRHPATGEQLAKRSTRSTMAAIDMTFSAPKSVSVLFAIGDERLAAALVEAHEEAVDAALGYLEREACRVRRGHNGTREERERNDPRGWERARSEPAGGFVAAAYRHRMSRAQDPQLHTHVVAANMARGVDGRWTALDARHIYEHAKAGGSVYQAHLRAAVRERLPWASWGPVRNGMAELEQVPPAVLHEFSTRRRRILEREEELVAAGVAVGDHGRERIAFDTREVKREVNEPDWHAEVRARAAEHGLGQEQVDELAALPARDAPEQIDERELSSRLFGASGLTATANTFGHRDVIAAVAAAAAQGLDVLGVQAVSQRLLASDELVEIPASCGRRFTTRELLEAEAGIVAMAVTGEGKGVATVGELEALMALSAGERLLSAEQEQLVLAIAGSGNRIDTVEALAGTGKTTSAQALRAVYERAGYKVLGAAPTGRAVRELKEQAGIADSRTLDGWLLKLENDPDALRSTARDQDPTSPKRPVLIIDEAGMASSRQSARLLEAAVAADAKVIAFGDSGQLASVQAGGWLGALSRARGSFELREVMRQRDPQERRGLARVHRGEPDGYLSRKEARGELTVHSGEHARAEGEQAAIDRWAEARATFGPEQVALICRDNQRRERLNQLAREHLGQIGELGEGIELAGREWRVGDRVIARRNDRERDLDNGTRATVTEVDAHDGLRVRTDSGASRQIDLEYASQHLEYAYALTGHGMQGGTVEWAEVIGRPGDFTRNWSYTALSRAREPTEIMLIDDATAAQSDRAGIAPGAEQTASGPVERMAVRMRDRDDEDLAIEQLAEPGSQALNRLRALGEEITKINGRLAELPLQELTSYERTERSLTSLQREHARLTEQRSWRERGVRKFNLAHVERQIADETERRRDLVERIGDPDAVNAEVERLKRERHELATARRELHARVIAEELDRQPRWLYEAIGPLPDTSAQRERWQRTARELAGYRLDHEITDPDRALGPNLANDPSASAARRALIDTRAALGLDAGHPGHDRGPDLGR